MSEIPADIIAIIEDSQSKKKHKVIRSIDFVVENGFEEMHYDNERKQIIVKVNDNETAYIRLRNGYAYYKYKEIEESKEKN